MGGGGAASSADRFAGEQQRGQDAGELGLPVAFLVAGDGGEVGKLGVDLRIVGGEEREQVVAEAVAGKGRIEVGGVFAPGLIDAAQPGFDLRAASGEKRAQDQRFGVDKGGMDAAETFRPGSAEKLVEDSLGLVVEGMGGGDGVELAGGQEVAEEGVTKVAGGLFESLAVGLSGGGGVHVVAVEGEAVPGGEVGNEGGIGVGFRPTNAVVNVDNGEDKADLKGGIDEGAEQGDGIGSAGDSHAEAHAGAQELAVEGGRDGLEGPGHSRDIW